MNATTNEARIAGIGNANEAAESTTGVRFDHARIRRQFAAGIGLKSSEEVTGGDAVAGSSTIRDTMVSDTQMTAAASTIVNHAIARIRRSIEFNCSTVNASPSPCAATSSCRPILNASPNVM